MKRDIKNICGDWDVLEGNLSSNPCFSFGKILPNFDLKKMISTYVKDFPWKKWPKFVEFKK